VAADTHFGAEGLLERNRKQIDAMNALPGTPWPAEIGGTVARPHGLLVAGDLTDGGLPTSWKQFCEEYGRDGRDGRLKFPAFEGSGNHDRGSFPIHPVLAGIRQRHGSLLYSWDWGELHVVCLDVYPDAAALRWLDDDLRKVGRERPVVLYFHYGLEGPFSDWWKEEEKDAFRRAVEGYHILAVFHGHWHASGPSRWRGLRVINVGSPRHSDHTFGVARYHDGRLDVAAWDWRRGRWAWRDPATR
jgi:cytolysin (calcineurin-like family phosphatase)